ncbi:M23 family metallopeptidase [Maritimibacter sp. DP1N21-5]|uniref:M23 family metallopeptidase n=1 Tax=Maritimibacter sp. DP1N21-5 TaxID=2836867 RepID=UPI001C4609B5|nr:M23 family metallopeptidase [Maritimibacter sp. DP1N21-5]MBV7409699.1 M23 family metallopeptidase [Maritimibacter sp. DP1N21-5]
MRFTTIFLILITLSGCDRAGFGTAVPYRAHVEPKIAVIMPPDAPSIAQQYMPLTKDGEPGHRGVDVAAVVGTPVLAAADGRVTASFNEPIYGNRIYVEHAPDATGRRVVTAYYHLDRRLVETGATVRRGQKIGTLGESGMLSSYPHLHFEVLRETAPGARTASGLNWWQGMAQEDPNTLWADGIGRVTCFRTATRYDPARITYPVACGRTGAL